MAPSREENIAVVDSCVKNLNFHVKFLNEAAPERITLDGFECRLAAVEPLYERFQLHHARVVPSLSAEEMLDYDDIYNNFSTDFFNLLVTLKEHIRLRKSEVRSNSADVRPSASSSSVKTPRLEIPTFDGSSSTWIRFRDIFESVIHTKANLSNVEKFSFLVSSVKLPAGESNVLDNFKVCDDDYEAAWLAICERYNDRKKIIAMHCSSLFGLEKMKCESKHEIQKIIDGFTSQISALKQLGYTLGKYDDFSNMIIVQLALSKLEPKTLREWKKCCTEDSITWQQLLDFLTTMSRSLDDETIPNVRKESENKRESNNQSKGSKSLFVAKAGNKSRNMKCLLCGETHPIWSCPKFNGMGLDERKQTIKEKRLCWNCFSPSHPVKDCVSKYRCKICNQLHHSLLHYSRTSTEQGRGHQTTQLSVDSKPFEPFNMKRTNEGGESSRNSNVVSHSSETFRNSRRQTFLSTVVIEVEDNDGSFHSVRALLDTGSDDNFMTTQLARKLNLQCENVCVPLTGIGERTSIVHHQTSAKISSRYGVFVKTLQFSVMSSITGNIPGQSVNVSKWSLPKSHFLADPKFNISAKIDMLLNIDVFYDALLPEQIDLVDGPKMQHTKLGWIIGGAVDSLVHQSPQALLSCYKISREIEDEHLEQMVDRYFRADEVDVDLKVWTPEEQYCEDLFAATTFRGEDGKFNVTQPQKSNFGQLGKNVKNAFQMLHVQECQRQKNPIVNRLYAEAINNYLDENHMEEVNPEKDEILHFLPHHPVIKMSSSSTKVRPVCNAASKSETGLSLNDTLCVGPVVQPESFDILLRFRVKPFVLMGDLTKMYRQIWVNPKQRAYLTILWRNNPETEKVKYYQMKTVTFGTASASFLATRVVMELANQNEKDFPRAAAIIKSSFYVDDLLAGFDSIDEAKLILSQLRNIFSSAGMTLCKLASNDPAILMEIPKHHVEASPENAENNIVKALGVQCELSEDQFTYRINTPPAGSKMTKTTVLSENASLYDPTGWIGPVILKGKLFLKKLWIQKLGWKEELPAELKEEWNDFRKELHLLNEIKIKRQCVITNAVRIELHGFSDASIEAYGCCIYILSEDDSGNIQSSLICAKSKVSPMKQQSLARLELCGALLLAKLVNRVVGIFAIQFDSVTLWCDSTIVLNWIGMLSSRLQTFVGNRVAECQRLSSKYLWRHGLGICNPADEISRGKSPKELIESTLWWHGPKFFKQPRSEWPKSIITVSEDDPEVKQEVKKSFVVKTDASMFEYIEMQHSQTRTVINVIAYILRFAHNARTISVKRDGELSIEEREAAVTKVLQIIQKTIFPSEYKVLEQQVELRAGQLAGEAIEDDAIPQISRKSSIISLFPIMDENRIIRVGGRLQACAAFCNDQKHPIILPRCRFATLTIRELHNRHMHAGLTALLSFVREKFWPLRAKSTIRKVIHDCIVCNRVKPVDSQQLMAPLPPARVNMAPPFTSTALDYAGFFTIRSGLTRNASTTKCYVAIFKCMCTAAIHLEVVSDLSTQAFIQTFDRFVSRRGLTKELYTDNATCFEGADRELKDVLEKIDPNIKDYMREQSIRWKFTTPRASHAGGIYESAVKNMKHHLKRVMVEQQHNFTFEQFATLLCKIEAILNSRPTTPMSEDPTDLDVLTPGHFLIGRPLIAKPEHNYLQQNTNRLDVYAKLQQAQQKFWNRWYSEYLHTLQQRPVKFREVYKFQVNDLVLLKDSNLPPMKWLRGRVVELFPNPKDKVVRNVKVKTQYGFKERHVKYLCLLPMEREAFESPQCVPDRNLEEITD